MGSCDFLFQLFLVLWETDFFNLSLMLLGGRIGDLCIFDGDFALLGVVSCWSDRSYVRFFV